MPKTETFDRKQVLKKATEIFHSKGYNGTSMQDLVDATTINRSSIYNSFGNKLGMFIEVLTYYQNDSNIHFSKKIATTYNAIDTIKGVFDAVVYDIIKDVDCKGCLLVNSTSEMVNQNDTIRSFIENHQDRMLAFLEDIVIRGQMERVFNTEVTAHQYALYLYTVIQGLQMTGILHKNKEKLTSIVETVLKSLE